MKRKSSLFWRPTPSQKGLFKKTVVLRSLQWPGFQRPLWLSKYGAKGFQIVGTPLTHKGFDSYHKTSTFVIPSEVFWRVEVSFTVNSLSLSQVVGIFGCSVKPDCGPGQFVLVSTRTSLKLLGKKRSRKLNSWKRLFRKCYQLVL